MTSDGFTKMEAMEGDTERAESSMEPSTMCPFSYPLGCVFAGEYLGLMWNPDYNTLRAVFQVNDRICNEEFISYFDNMRELIAEQEKARGVKIWRGFAGPEDYPYQNAYKLWIWAPPECALDENDDPQKEDFFIAAQSFEFIFEEPRPPANYDTGFNYIIEKNETTDSYLSLVEDYEALVNRWFIGRYYGIRRGENIEEDFAVFKMDKYQPTHHGKRFRSDMYKLNEIDSTEAFGFVMDDNNNILIYCPPECALDVADLGRKFKLEITKIKFFDGCNHSRNLHGIGTGVEVHVGIANY